MRIAPQLDLTDDERTTLARWVRSHSTQQRLVFRAKIILQAVERNQNKDITDRLSANRSHFNQQQI